MTYSLTELPDLTGMENLIPDDVWEWVMEEVKWQMELRRILKMDV